MLGSTGDQIAVLRQFNPWWRGSAVPDLPTWRRRAFDELLLWMQLPPAPRATLLTGARQIGKTTLFLQVIQKLLDDGVPANRILYATFDHPLLKLLGLDGLLRLWREFEPMADGQYYLFLDEVQGVPGWDVWLKHQVDFDKRLRIAVTGSAMPLLSEGQESGVGRWQILRLTTLSFFEYLQLRKVELPPLPGVRSLADLRTWSPHQLAIVAADARPLEAHFKQYLSRGGFPQCALVENLATAQRLLREDIVDKVLKRDMTALFGVRNILELEQIFLYLCLHGGGLLDVQTLCKNLGLTKPTVLRYIELLTHTHLIHKLSPFGYGKEVLRGRPKIYLADPAIAPATMLRGDTLHQDETLLGLAVETAFVKDLAVRMVRHGLALSYWQGSRDQEVDLIAETRSRRLVPFEVKYRHASKTGLSALAGLREFCREREVPLAYVITKDLDDMGTLPLELGTQEAIAVKVPAPLACYWLGRHELEV
jgi:predicted AAA+ superfamily ATPase